jgi:hypothetical protein
LPAAETRISRHQYLGKWALFERSVDAVKLDSSSKELPTFIINFSVIRNDTPPYIMKRIKPFQMVG